MLYDILDVWVICIAFIDINLEVTRLNIIYIIKPLEKAK